EIDARRRAIERLQQNTQIAAFRAAKQQMDWRSGKDEEALRLYEEAIRTGVGPGLASILGQAPGSTFAASAVAVDSKQYDALLKALKPLTRKGSTLDEAKFLVGFGQAVVDQMKEDLKAAAKEETSDGPTTPANPGQN
ncbi:MAG TPA: hypothetical protein VFR28_10285, partial [Allosphingosinicella sp.]|nr:hypothetical protein [Allosphingosinicella sp.]